MMVHNISRTRSDKPLVSRRPGGKLTTLVSAPRCLLFGLLLALPGWVVAGLPPEKFEYDVSKNDFSLGSTQREFRQLDTGLYEMQAITEAEGFVALFFSETVRETSRFRLVDDQVQPLHYRYHKNGKKPETFEVDFDREQQLLRHSLLGKTWPLHDNDQDLLSFQIAMMLQLQQAVRQLDYRIADKKRIENYSLVPNGEKVFDTQLGKLHTVVMEYYDKKRKRTYTFWCARELDYLPYQSRRIEADGDVIQLRLRRYNGRPASLK